MQSVRTLMAASIDYAGLFPPAKLDMPAAVRAYAACREGPHSWMLGRFVVPVGRLAEFDTAAEALLPRDPMDPWRLSALTSPAGDSALDADLDAIYEFNAAHSREDASAGGPGAAVIDMIELKAEDSRAVDAAIDLLPQDMRAFFEVPIDKDPRGLVASLAGESGVGAKVRTGGVTPEAFPTGEQLARFIVACAAAAAPFKATAGLHHPIRGPFPLTYEPGAARCAMFGFLNVLLAAALAFTDRLNAGETLRILEETSRDAFGFDERGVIVRGRRLENDRLSRAREAFILSFGSCSFDEPVADLQALGALSA